MSKPAGMTRHEEIQWWWRPVLRRLEDRLATETNDFQRDMLHDRIETAQRWLSWTGPIPKFLDGNEEHISIAVRRVISTGGPR
jgi:lysyl-tRNA synthetase class I